jgi:hypothetical protein
VIDLTSWGLTDGTDGFPELEHPIANPRISIMAKANLVTLFMIKTPYILNTNLKSFFD